MPSEQPQPPVDDRLQLTVIEARREDVGRGIVRLDPATLKEIGAAPGDVLAIEGRTRTVAKAMPTFKEQRGQAVIQLDGVARANAGVTLGQKITVAKVAHASARRAPCIIFLRRDRLAWRQSANGSRARWKSASSRSCSR